MSDQRPTLEQLQSDIARLTARVWALEQSLAEHSATEPVRSFDWQDPVPAPPTAPRSTAAIRQPAATPAASAARVPIPPRAARDPIDWGKVAARVFTARTLAWAGAVATVLGVVLLFVLAARRGWVTPPMRLGIGTFVSIAVLSAALELDRRAWRADAILAAAGAGIAGLYATLWAAASLYAYVSAPAASGLAAAVAALAVGVAIRLRQEPLAVFGISAAMLAPVLISLEITAYGLLYAAVMLGAAICLVARLRWDWLAAAAWLVAAGEAAALLIHREDHVGFGAPVVAVGSVVLLLVCLLMLVELRPATRSRITQLGWLIAASSFTLSIGDAFLFGGAREVDGHSLSGIALVGVMAAWAAAAAVPHAVRRVHSDLTDVLAAFALTLGATATGLLLGGAALPSAWAAQSALLVVAAERIARRSHVRQVRITIAAGAYLTLATIAAVWVVAPTTEHLPTLGAGSWQGSLAIAGIAVAGVVYCYGTRWIAHPAQMATWALPGVAIAYLPLWALGGTWADVALAGLAAALLAYRRSAWLVWWLQDAAAIAMAVAWWVIGAAVALRVTAPLRELTAPGWSGVGARHGLVPLAALTAAAAVAAWSLRRPRRPDAELMLVLPVATLVYLLAEALPVPYAMWSWMAVGAALAAVAHVPPIRRRLLPVPLIACSAGTLAFALIGAWSHDDSLSAIAHHGTSRGWPSILIACLTAGLLASAFLDPRRRSHALWLPLTLAVQLACMLLPGQYPVVVAAGLALVAALLAVAWPRPLAARLDRAVIAQIAVFSALGGAAAVLTVYETPRMLFVSSHGPAAGLAAALAVTAALYAAAAAASVRSRRAPWTVGPVEASTALVYLAGAASLWTLSAAILGAEQLVARPGVPESVRDHFQQGQVLVSISWVLVGLALVVASLRGDRRGLRAGGIALLFVALGKLFLYDLAFLTAMARAVSFIATGSVLLVAALLLQRFAPQMKAALGEDQPRPVG
jgi:hypothetical protein